jgi:ribonuclease HI
MNLLSHRNVRVVARFQRSTFAFLPPDHWASSWDGGPRAGKANWQVMVIEIANQSGRDMYKKGPDGLIAESGRSFGAKPVSNHCANTRKHHNNKFQTPNEQFQKAPTYSQTSGHSRYRQPDLRTQPSQTSTAKKQESPLQQATSNPGLDTQISNTSRRFPAGQRVFTDGSLIDRKGVGASYYEENTRETVYIQVDQKDILRAELTAILKIVQDRELNPEPLQIFTDSLTSIRLVRRWIHCPSALSKTDNLDLLDSLAHAIVQRAPARTELYKVRAHIGCEGNEFADAGAKMVASGRTEDIDVVRAHTTHTPPGRSVTPFALSDGERITKPKEQLRQVITDWLTVTRGLKTKVSDMWQGKEASELDAVASNAVLWGSGLKKGIYRPLHVLRFRFLEVVTKAKLHAQNPVKHPDQTCDLCTQTGNWFHMASMCPHPDISEYYTVRHNAAGKELTKGSRGGKLGRWLTITSFGKIDGLGDPETIPLWMLSEEGRNRVKQRQSIPDGGMPGDTSAHGAGDELPSGGGIRPDIMILEGWPETSPPPGGATKTYKGGGGESRRVTIIIAELGFSSDLGFQKTVDRKQHKYAPLIKELEKEGWTVRHTVHVITVGVRATVPIRNVEVLKSLGIIEKPAQQKVQASMTHVAAAHLNRIVPQYRRLCARQNKCINEKKTGVG